MHGGVAEACMMGGLLIANAVAVSKSVLGGLIHRQAATRQSGARPATVSRNVSDQATQW